MRQNIVLGYLGLCGLILSLFTILFTYWIFLDPVDNIQQPAVSIETIDDQAIFITRQFCTSKRVVLRLQHYFLNVDKNRIIQLRPQSYIAEKGCNSDKFSIDLPASDGVYAYKSFAVYYLNPIMQNNVFEFPDVSFKVENHAGYIITSP